MKHYVGIDWSEKHQDWAVVDDTGKRLAMGRFLETPAGFAKFEGQIRLFTDPDTGLLPTVAIETDKGVTVTALLQAGYPVHAINPMKVARYRERYGTGHNKSDKGDAKMIADILRTDPGVHRQMPANSDQVMQLSVLCRAHQDAVWGAMKQAQELRSHLRLYWPHFLTLFTPAQFLRMPEWLAVLHYAPTPTEARRLTPKRLERILRQAGRTRYIDRDVAKYLPLLKEPVLQHPAAQEGACGDATRAMVSSIQRSLAVRDDLADMLVLAVRDHPLYPIYESCPSMGDVTAARILGEIGDDLDRFRSPGGLKAFAGTAPTDRASGKAKSVTRRRVKNNRLNTAAHMWALVAIRRGGGARVAYDRRRQIGDRHNAALRNLSNRLIGCLWHCLHNGELWDEQLVWGHLQLTDEQLAVTAETTADEVERDAVIEASESLDADTTEDVA